MVVDEEDKVIGIISLSDLLMYLVLRPTGECAAGGTSLRNEHAPIQEKDENTISDTATIDVSPSKETIHEDTDTSIQETELEETKCQEQ